jgi:hypothetical protein
MPSNSGSTDLRLMRAESWKQASQTVCMPIFLALAARRSKFQSVVAWFAKLRSWAHDVVLHAQPHAPKYESAKRGMRGIMDIRLSGRRPSRNNKSGNYTQIKNARAAVANIVVKTMSAAG